MKYSLLLTLSAFLMLWSCESQRSPESESIDVQLIRGDAQGTTYSIKYTGEEQVEKAQIDSILDQIDLSMSAWVDKSVLSEFNREDSIAITDDHFLTVFFRGKEIHDLTDGAFHPMIRKRIWCSRWTIRKAGRRVELDLSADGHSQRNGCRVAASAVPR